MINSTGSTQNVYLFAGEAFDSALGLYYNRARYFNATTGRFWTPDIYEGDPRSPLHRYLYASADPVDRIDPRGHLDFSLASLSAVAGAITTLATNSFVIAVNVLGSTYLALYELPQIVESSNNYFTIGLGAFEALHFLGTNIASYAGSYSRGPVIRGNQFEQAAGANMGPTYPAIDYWDPNTGTSMISKSQEETEVSQHLEDWGLEAKVVRLS